MVIKFKKKLWRPDHPVYSDRMEARDAADILV